jgi:hypothetical protein
MQSRVKQIKNDFFIPLRHSYVAILDGDTKAAMMLAFFVYWDSIKYSHIPEAKRMNERPLAGPYSQDKQYEGLIQWHTVAGIQEYFAGHMGKDAVNSAVKKLESYGYLSVFKNPKYVMDQTKHYFLQADAINKALQKYEDSLPDEPFSPDLE